MFFPLSPLRQHPQALSSSNPIHVAPFFLSVFLGPPDLRVSIFLFVSYSFIPQSRTSPELSPSFVALVKSSLARLYFLSLLSLVSRRCWLACSVFVLLVYL